MKFWILTGILSLFLTVGASAQATTANLSITKPQTGQAQPQVTIATAFDQFDAAIAGRLSKSVAGSSDVTLTTAEARNAIIELTGTITANLNLIVPAKNKIYLVYNNSTGAFTLTVKTPSGTGIAVPQGERKWLYCDSTNVVEVTGGGGGGGGGATTALDNLASVNLNSALLAQTSIDLGSTLKPFRNLYLYGGGTFGTHYFKFDGTPTGGRTLTLPDRTANLATTLGSLTSGNCAKFDASGNLVDHGSACRGGGGSSAWDAITNPAGNQALSMGAFTTSWAWGNSTGASDLFNLTDSTTNSSATGRLVNIATTTGSTLRPFRVAAAGTEAIFTNQLGATLFGSTTAAHANSKVEISGNATDGSGNSLLRLIASGSQGTGITLQNSSHTWSVINRNNNTLGLYYHGNNYAFQVSYTDVEAARFTNNHVAGLPLIMEPTGSGGRTWILYSTANSHALGGGNFTIRDESSAATRVRINSSGTIFLGPASPGTTATEGFINLPTTNGGPTGTPGTLVTGYSPLVLEEDTTNSQYLLWGYLNGAWRNLSNGVGRATYTGVGGGSTNINFANFRIHEFTFGAGSETLTFSNIPNGQTITLAIIQDGTGSRTLTWPATAKFVGGTIPTLSTAAGARDIIQFYSDGTNLYQSAPILLDVK